MISILLPTRNRLPYLKLAVASVLRQDVEDWQLVISDNCSEDDIGGYASSLGDPRIVYSRTDGLLPVTENWSRALALSKGEYVVMLGDDDALLDGYLQRMEELIATFEDPDVIYTKALLFTYPGVDPSHPDGFVMDHGCAEFYGSGTEPFVLDRSRAVEMAKAAMSFRMLYDFNAQFALISRRLIDSLSSYGDFYQSAFPDYYSMNAAFLQARRIIVDPAPRVVIGVTPKSYGFFHVNDMESEGRSFLEGQAATETTGTNINVGWLSAMTALEKGPGGDAGFKVDHRRYRLVQAAHVYKRYRAGGGSREDVRRFERELPLLERWLYRLGDGSIALVHSLLPQRLKATLASFAVRRVGQLPSIDPTIVEGRYKDIVEVIDARRSASAPQAGGSSSAVS
jgi:glycosyltransferase involved in cell wall biosynthesis